MADKKSEVRIPEEHLHLNGKIHHLPVVKDLGLGLGLSYWVPNDDHLYLLW